MKTSQLNGGEWFECQSTHTILLVFIRYKMSFHLVNIENHVIIKSLYMAIKKVQKYSLSKSIKIDSTIFYNEINKPLEY